MTVKVVAPTREYTFDRCQFELLPEERAIKILDENRKLKAVFSLETIYGVYTEEYKE